MIAKSIRKWDDMYLVLRQLKDDKQVRNALKGNSRTRRDGVGLIEGKIPRMQNATERIVMGNSVEVDNAVVITHH